MLLEQHRGHGRMSQFNIKETSHTRVLISLTKRKLISTFQSQPMRQAGPGEPRMGAMSAYKEWSPTLRHQWLLLESALDGKARVGGNWRGTFSSVASAKALVQRAAKKPRACLNGGMG